MANSAAEGEPTMEEILSSIRKIISEDEPQPGEAAKDQEAAEEAAPAAAAGMAQAEVEELVDEVLELTDRVEEGAGQPGPDSSEEREIDAILTTVTDAPAGEMQETETQRSSTGGLISPKTDTAVTSTLANFFDEMVKDKTPQEAQSGSSPTLDSIVREMLGPYLKAWLDENLEPIVERTVRDELKRMARRAEDF